MTMSSATFGLLLASLLLINVDARLPPQEARRPSTPESSTSDSSISAKPSGPDALPDSPLPDSSGAAIPSQDSVNSPLDEIEAWRQSLFHLFRHLDNMHPRFPSILGAPDEGTAENPLDLLQNRFLLQTPSLIPFPSDPNFSFLPQMPFPLNPNKVNETRFVYHGREYCQTVYDKVQNNGYGVFSSRVLTVQPCDQGFTGENGETATDLPTAQDTSKKQDDHRNRPGVEREEAPTETPIPAGSNNREPNEVKPSSTTAQPDQLDAKPKDKSSENEIADKPAEPFITVNDGK